MYMHMEQQNTQDMNLIFKSDKTDFIKLSLQEELPIFIKILKMNY